MKKRERVALTFLVAGVAFGLTAVFTVPLGLRNGVMVGELGSRLWNQYEIPAKCHNFSPDFLSR